LELGEDLHKKTSEIFCQFLLSKQTKAVTFSVQEAVETPKLMTFLEQSKIS